MRQNLLHAAFPDDDHAPAEAAELLAGTLVACDVARELRLPKFAARLRRRRAGTALVPMPEAAVHENHRPVFPQHDVGRSRQRPVARIRFSGPVSLLRTRDILRERTSAEILSIFRSPSRSQLTTSIQEVLNFSCSNTLSRSKRGGHLIRSFRRLSGTFVLTVNCAPCGCHVNLFTSVPLA